MGNGNCHVTTGSLDSEAVQKTINSLLKGNPYIKTANILISSGSNDIESDFSIGLTDVKSYQNGEFSNLLGAIQELSFPDDAKSLSSIYLHAKSNEISKDLSITNSFTLKNNNLRVRLNESSFQRVPNLANLKSPKFEVKKIKESKTGHGAKNYVSYNYSITSSMEIRNNYLVLPEELKYLIETIFSHCIVRIVAYKAPIAFLDSKTPSISTSQIASSVVNLLPLSTDIEKLQQVDSSELYEYLTLLTLDCSQLQLKNPVDDYISIYSPPEFPSHSDVDNSDLVKVSVSDIHSEFLVDYIREANWRVISLHSEETHLLLFKSQVNAVVVWNIN
ncbi:uncharacterized protein RJT20DRAFT_3713 [Scheffersomyces xylosifermentans]|uniref:uncharacterized protein n=1 Tax=Scheffersomyces xylosifermentans TaxID=1304137 RepID=UPI00315CE2F6